MNTLKLTMAIQKLNGFSESEFIDILANNLEEVGVKALRYGEFEDGYRFEMDYEVAIPEFPYQPILGVFQSIGMDYDKVKLISMPIDKIALT